MLSMRGLPDFRADQTPERDDCRRSSSENNPAIGIRSHRTLICLGQPTHDSTLVPTLIMVSFQEAFQQELPFGRQIIGDRDFALNDLVSRDLGGAKPP